MNYFLRQSAYFSIGCAVFFSAASFAEDITPVDNRRVCFKWHQNDKASSGLQHDFISEVLDLEESEKYEKVVVGPYHQNYEIKAQASTSPAGKCSMGYVDYTLQKSKNTGKEEYVYKKRQCIDSEAVSPAAKGGTASVATMCIELALVKPTLANSDELCQLAGHIKMYSPISWAAIDQVATLHKAMSHCLNRHGPEKLEKQSH